jgi:hypothetical protein
MNQLRIRIKKAKAGSTSLEVGDVFEVEPIPESTTMPVLRQKVMESSVDSATGDLIIELGEPLTD